MNAKKSGKTKDKSAHCGPGDSGNMFEMMGRCRAGRGGFDSCMAEAMKRRSCCGPEPDKETGGDDGETESCC